MHYYRHGRIGDFVVREPLVLGHEAAGHGRRLRSGRRPPPDGPTRLHRARHALRQLRGMPSGSLQPVPGHALPRHPSGGRRLL
ncbi:hypothetical protein OHU45_36800 [Streptomyces tubercidicus]|uniref:hypothetical protein n=1 Tax=Streptomyces tubercidicus TaxID=47759 RepID=UPI0030E1AA83|nr:hypothetical protein OG690_00585 [Streptomyces tubercidicus]